MKGVSSCSLSLLASHFVSVISVPLSLRTSNCHSCYSHSREQVKSKSNPVRLKAVLLKISFFKYQVNELSVPLRRATWAYYLRYAGETLKILKKVSDGQEGERRKKVKLVNR